MKRHLIFITLITAMLTTCEPASIEKKREVIISLLDAVEDPYEIEFYAKEFDENRLSYIDDEILEYMANSKKFEDLVNLKISYLNNITGKGLKHLLKLKNLDYLYLAGSKTITCNDLQLLSEHKTLTRLHIGAFAKINNLELHNFKHLEYIEIDQCKRLQNASFKNIPKCERIEFDRCPGLTAQSIIKINNCNNTAIAYIRCLNLNQVNINTNDSIKDLSIASSYLAFNGLLKTRKIKGLKKISLQNIKIDSIIIPKHPGLEYFNIIEYFTRDDTLPRSKLIILNSPKLLSINIDTENSYKVAMDRIPSLRTLHLSEFKYDKLNLAKFENLEQLSIKGNGSDRVLDNISQLKNLTKLGLKIDNITTEGIKKLARLKNLDSLSLEITGEYDLKKIHIDNLESLTELYISSWDYHNEIEDVCVSNCKCLNKLRMSNHAKNICVDNCEYLLELNLLDCHPTTLSISGVNYLMALEASLIDVINMDNVFRQINKCENLIRLKLEMPVTNKVVDMSILEHLPIVDFGDYYQDVEKLILNKKHKGKDVIDFGYNGPIEYK